eukprot:scaffold57300_cov69-Phaeocystis_antarctica.AAC.1
MARPHAAPVLKLARRLAKIVSSVPAMSASMLNVSQSFSNGLCSCWQRVRVPQKKRRMEKVATDVHGCSAASNPKLVLGGQKRRNGAPTISIRLHMSIATVTKIVAVEEHHLSAHFGQLGEERFARKQGREEVAVTAAVDRA